MSVGYKRGAQPAKFRLEKLPSIINKALASITEKEKTAVRNKYLAIKFQQEIDKAEVIKWVLVGGGAVLGVVLVFMFWNRRLSREIGKLNVGMRREAVEKAKKIGILSEGM